MWRLWRGKVLLTNTVKASYWRGDGGIIVTKRRVNDTIQVFGFRDELGINAKVIPFLTSVICILLRRRLAGRFITLFFLSLTPSSLEIRKKGLCNLVSVFSVPFACKSWGSLYLQFFEITTKPPLFSREESADKGVETTTLPAATPCRCGEARNKCLPAKSTNTAVSFHV